MDDKQLRTIKNLSLNLSFFIESCEEIADLSEELILAKGLDGKLNQFLEREKLNDKLEPKSKISNRRAKGPFAYKDLPPDKVFEMPADEFVEEFLK